MKKPSGLLILTLLILYSCRRESAIVDNSSEAWYKQQIIYNLDIKTFKDSDGDGIGDINGLTDKLGYLDSLGITTIWLAPFQPSPLEDDGYDVTDYTGIDKRLGNSSDFASFLRAAKQKHIRVIIDVVLNHTSIKYPWFRQKPTWYLWSAQRPPDWNKGMGFPEVEKQTWLKDSLFGKYYFHRFYHFEPDLNYQNPQVLAEAKRVLNYWLQQGVDGFRLDAVPFIIDDPRKSAEEPEHDFSILHQIANAVKQTRPDAALLGEANVKPEEVKDYFSEKTEGLDMMLNFEVNEYLFYAFATGDAKPLGKALENTSVKPSKDQWAYFLRNHDEIDLGKLSKADIKKVYTQMGPDTNMQLYGRGIRRRLSPMLNNTILRLKQAYAVMLALPGTPIIRYGDEIGMGDDLSLKERLSVRTPMQWDSTVNGGFTVNANPFRHVISTGVYNYKNVNVMRQSRDKHSLLSFVKTLIKIRKTRPEIGQGFWDIPDIKNDHCLLIHHRRGGNDLLSVTNYSANLQKVKLPEAGTFVDLISGSKLSTNENGELFLPALAAYWLIPAKRD